MNWRALAIFSPYTRHNTVDVSALPSLILVTDPQTGYSRESISASPSIQQGESIRPANSCLLILNINPLPVC